MGLPEMLTLARDIAEFRLKMAVRFEDIKIEPEGSYYTIEILRDWDEPKTILDVVIKATKEEYQEYLEWEKSIEEDREFRYSLYPNNID